MVCNNYSETVTANDVRKQAAAIIPGMPTHTTAKDKYEKLSKEFFYKLPLLMERCTEETVRKFSSTMFKVSMVMYFLQSLTITGMLLIISLSLKCAYYVSVAGI